MPRKSLTMMRRGSAGGTGAGAGAGGVGVPKQQQRSSLHSRFRGRSSLGNGDGGSPTGVSPPTKSLNRQTSAPASSSSSASGAGAGAAPGGMVRKQTSIRGSMRSILKHARRSARDSMGTLGSSVSTVLTLPTLTLAELVSGEDWSGVRAMLTECGTAEERRAMTDELGRCPECPEGGNALHYVCRFRPPLDVVRLLEEAASVAPGPGPAGEKGGDDGSGGDATPSDSANNNKANNSNGARDDLFAAEDCTERTPLHYAAKYGASPEVLALLLRRSPGGAAKADVVGKTPLHHLAEAYASNCEHHRGGGARGERAAAVEDHPFGPCGNQPALSADARRKALADARRLDLRDDMKLAVKLLLRASPSSINAEDDADMTPVEYAIDCSDGRIDISVVKLLQKASEREWKRKVSECREERRRSIKEAVDGPKSEQDVPSALQSSSSPASTVPTTTSSGRRATSAAQDAEKAVADLLGSVNLAAFSTALGKSSKSVIGESSSCSDGGDSGEKVADSIKMHIPMNPKRRTSPSPTARCA